MAILRCFVERGPGILQEERRREQGFIMREVLSKQVNVRDTKCESELFRR